MRPHLTVIFLAWRWRTHWAWLAPARELIVFHSRYRRSTKHSSCTYSPTTTWSISPLSEGVIDGGKNSAAPLPPTPFRDENSVILAGEIPSSGIPAEDGDELSSLPLRQSVSSRHPLLSPPRSIPNPYGWMRDDSRTNTTVMNHLRAENEYTEGVTSHLGGLREEIYQEFLSSIQETDYTTPALRTSAGGSYWYYTRFEEGESYPRYCRAPQSTSDELYPPLVNEEWDTKITNTNNETSFPPLMSGEEVYLDVPAMARNKTYLAVGAIAVSPNQKYVAYSLDEKGGETCQLYVKHIKTGEEWILSIYRSDQHVTDEGADVLECNGSVVWDDESRSVYYVTMDGTNRSYRLFRRQIFDRDGGWIDYSATHAEEDQLMLEEEDELFNLQISKTFCGKYLIARSSSKESSEVHYLDLRPNENSEIISTSSMAHSHERPSLSNLTCIAKRKHMTLYRVTHCRGYWLIQTNIGGLPNLSLKACRVGQCGVEFWKDVVTSDAGEIVAAFDGGHKRSLDGVTVFTEGSPNDSHSLLAYGVVTGREDGIPRIWVLEFSEEEINTTKGFSSLIVSKMTRLEFDEDAYDVGIGGNRDPTLDYVVISYDSLITPPSHIAIPLYNPSSLEARRVLKEKEVPGYDKGSYACERTIVRSRDGKTDIPVSLIYHRDVLQEKGKPVPTHMYGYGSYGAAIEASFRSTRLPLLRRKVVYALAHVRGGGELGRPWYEGAKYLTKKNTFNDFVDVARWLVSEDTDVGSSAKASLNPSIGGGITTPDKLSCEGRSAGGLLIGASLNQNPEAFCAAVLGVPFVDVACTMTDATIPLTVAEWEEWGNPNEERYFDYIMSYCPMNNIKHAVYPACLVTGGLHDPRVQYWEPAKFVAELRHRASKKSGPVLLKMDMESGHFSASDRYKYLRELAFEYAFLLNALDAVDAAR